ncbi:hypothetical protein SRABI76_03431 [Microbacterium oxydans]|nr:hypothetical protein SRABI76_03431 [Microbacterium oxydans]
MHGAREAGVPESGRLLEGPHRLAHHRCGRGIRCAAARRHDRGADQRQHRRRTRPRRAAARLPVRLRRAGQGRRRQDRCPARLRRRGGHDPDLRRTGQPGVVLQRERSARHRDPRRVQTEPVRQPERSPQPLRDDGAGDLAGHRGDDHALRRRRRHGRHDHRHRTLPARGLGRPGAHRRDRSGGQRLQRWYRAPVPRGGRRGGHLARLLRPDRAARDRGGRRRGVLRDDTAPRPRGGHPGRRIQRHGGGRRTAHRA